MRQGHRVVMLTISSRVRGNDGQDGGRGRRPLPIRMAGRTVASAIMAGLMVVSSVTLAPSAAHAETARSASARLQQISDEYDATQKRLDNTTDRLEELQGSIDQAQQRADRAGTELQSVANGSYKGDDDELGALVSAATSSDTFEDMLGQVKYATTLTGKASAAIAEAKQAKSDLEGQKADQQKAVDDMNAQLADLDRQKTETKDLVGRLTESERQAVLANARVKRVVDDADGNGSKAQSATVTPSANGNAVLAEAYKYIGTPYRYGGSTPSGFDCSGYVLWVMNHTGNGGKVSGRSTYSMIAAAKASGRWTTDLSQLKPGDPVFTSGHHVGVLTSNGNGRQYSTATMVHSPKPSSSVRTQNLYGFIGGIVL